MLSGEWRGEWGRQGCEALGEARTTQGNRDGQGCAETWSTEPPQVLWDTARQPKPEPALHTPILWVLGHSTGDESFCTGSGFSWASAVAWPRAWCPGSVWGSPSRLPTAAAPAQQGFLVWGSPSTKAATLLLDPSRHWKRYSPVLLKSPPSYKSFTWCFLMCLFAIEL